jgi:hypothetical protein
MHEKQYFRSNFFAHLAGAVFPPFFNTFVHGKRRASPTVKFCKKKYVVSEDIAGCHYLYFGHLVLQEGK